jgi:hypothetical protein
MSQPSPIRQRASGANQPHPIPLGAQAPFDATSNRDAAFPRDARHDATFERDAAPTRNANLDATADRDAAIHRDDLPAARERPHSYERALPPFSRPITPRTGRISGYTLSQVTPAPQRLVTDLDLSRITQRSRSRTYRQSQEADLIQEDPIIEPPSPVPLNAFAPLNAPTTSTADRDSFSLVNPTNAVPTPELPAINPTSDSLVELRLTSIQAVAAVIRDRRNSSADVLGSLRVTFEPSLVNEFFPQKFVEYQPSDESQRAPRYRFHTDYAEHLLETMSLTADSLNAFLRAAGSPRDFTFGASVFYAGQTFEELLYREWVTLQVARRFEQRLLKCLRSAFHAISVFINDSEEIHRGPYRAPSPAFTTDSSFAYEIGAILETNNSQSTSRHVSSPQSEDVIWHTLLQSDLAQASQQPLPVSRPESRARSEASTSRSH